MYIKGEENMKNKTMLRFLLCFLIISVFCGICSQPISLAVSTGSFFNYSASTAINKVNDNMTPMMHIQSLIMYSGIFIAVAVVGIYAVQWMMATPAKRQELKASMWPLIIGVALLVIGPKLAINIYNEFLLKTSSLNSKEVVKYIGLIAIDVVQKLGYVVGAVMILVVGIQWLISTPNKRQELKGRMLNIIIGAALLIAGVTILGLIEKTASDVKNNLDTVATVTPSPSGESGGGSGDSGGSKYYAPPPSVSPY